MTKEYYDYDEWVVDSNGYHVKIELISYSFVLLSTGEPFLWHVGLTYTKYTDEDLAVAQSEKFEQHQAIDNDL